MGEAKKKREAFAAAARIGQRRLKLVCDNGPGPGGGGGHQGRVSAPLWISGRPHLFTFFEVESDGSAGGRAVGLGGWGGG